jgi:hypothetical protein
VFASEFEGDLVVKAYSAVLPTSQSASLSYLPGLGHSAIVNIPEGATPSTNRTLKLLTEFLPDGILPPDPTPPTPTHGLLVVRFEWADNTDFDACADIIGSQLRLKGRDAARCNPILLVDVRTKQQYLCESPDLELYGSLDCDLGKKEEGGIAIKDLIPGDYQLQVVQVYKKVVNPPALSVPFTVAAGRPLVVRCRMTKTGTGGLPDPACTVVPAAAPSIAGSGGP